MSSGHHESLILHFLKFFPEFFVFIDQFLLLMGMAVYFGILLMDDFGHFSDFFF